jgi:hypothetical protein
LINSLRFYVLLKNFSLKWRRHHCRWTRPAKFRPMFGAQGLWAGRVFIVPDLLWHGTSVFLVSYSEGPPQLVASYDTRGDVWRIYSNSDLHGFINTIYNLVSMHMHIFIHVSTLFCPQTENNTVRISDLIQSRVFWVFFYSNCTIIIYDKNKGFDWMYSGCDNRWHTECGVVSNKQVNCPIWWKFDMICIHWIWRKEFKTYCFFWQRKIVDEWYM